MAIRLLFAVIALLLLAIPAVQQALELSLCSRFSYVLLF